MGGGRVLPPEEGSSNGKRLIITPCRRQRNHFLEEGQMRRLREDGLL